MPCTILDAIKHRAQQGHVEDLVYSDRMHGYRVQYVNYDTTVTLYLDGTISQSQQLRH